MLRICEQCEHPHNGTGSKCDSCKQPTQRARNQRHNHNRRQIPSTNHTQARKQLNTNGYGTCHRCTQQLPANQLQIHHKTPIHLGGTDHPGNLQTLCHPCHRNQHKTSHPNNPPDPRPIV